MPGLCADLTRKYLGLEVPNNAVGALQDPHWSGGSVGDFPTYARAAPAAARAGPGGDRAPVRAWLGDKVWRWGRGKDAPEIIEAACGAPFDATFFCD